MAISQGTWLMIKTGHDYDEPEFIEFDNDQILHFGIETGSDSGILKKRQISKESLSDIKQEILEKNRIRIFRMGKTYTVLSETESTIKDTEFATDYVKIEPTLTQMAKTEILEMEYYAEWNGEKFPIIFNRDLDSPPIKEMNKRLQREGRKLVLEILQGTYFISIFDNGIRERLIGVKEITKEKAVLFGFPEEPYEIVAKSSQQNIKHDEKNF